LNIHTTSQGIVSFAFASKPVITFPTTDVLTVTSESMTVEFPYADVEKITLDDDPTGVEVLTVREQTDAVLIYDLSGKLVRQSKAKAGAATVNLSDLRPGIYVVKDGKRTYKVRKN
jgi:hypothetical protein